MQMRLLLVLEAFFEIMPVDQVCICLKFTFIFTFLRSHIYRTYVVVKQLYGADGGEEVSATAGY